MRRVTFSRNYTISLSRTCQCYCKYCSFATHRAHLYAPEEVERMLDDALRRNAKELLVLTGEKPEVNPEVAERLRSYGQETCTDYVACTSVPAGRCASLSPRRSWWGSPSSTRRVMRRCARWARCMSSTATLRR